jgi:S1-C subfamily serine protease
MRLGDVLTRIAGRAVTDPAAALATISETPPGKSLPVSLIRKGQKLSLTVVVGKRQPRTPATVDEPER